MDFAQLSSDVRGLLQLVAGDEGFKKPEFTVSAGSKAGDNYMGVVYRVGVRETQDGGRTSGVSLIVKCQPESEVRRIRFRSSSMFANEAAFYNEVIPAFISFQKQKGITSNISPPHARCLLAGETIVLEDQSPFGFVMRERQDPLDLAHCLLMMRELGRLHAVSFALRDQRPTLFKRLSTSIKETIVLKDNHTVMIAWYGNVFLKAINKFEERSRVADKDKYVDAMRRMNVDYFSKIIELVNPVNAEPYAVINHADCWTNNLLFKYKEGCKEPENVCLLDFQIARLASPACDITYFLFCCTDKKLRDEHYSNLLQEYHTSLATHLASLGSDVDKLFPMEALQDQLKQFGRYGLTMAVGLIPMFTCNANEIPDLDDACSDDTKSFDQAFDFDHANDKECWDRVCGIIVDAVDFGYLD